VADDAHHYRAPEQPVVPLVTVQRMDNGDLVIVINGQASAVDVMLSILRAMGAS
jgi:hypothetical protein